MIKINVTLERRVWPFCHYGKDAYEAAVTLEYSTTAKEPPDFRDIEQALDALKGEKLIVEEVVSKTVDILHGFGVEPISVVARAVAPSHGPVVATWTRGND